MIITTEGVWQEFSTKLKQFILKHVPEQQSAEDILQDVFVKIHTQRYEKESTREILRYLSLRNRKGKESYEYSTKR